MVKNVLWPQVPCHFYCLDQNEVKVGLVVVHVKFSSNYRYCYYHCSFAAHVKLVVVVLAVRYLRVDRFECPETLGFRGEAQVVNVQHHIYRHRLIRVCDWLVYW